MSITEFMSSSPSEIQKISDNFRSEKLNLFLVQLQESINQLNRFKKTNYRENWHLNIYKSDNEKNDIIHIIIKNNLFYERLRILFVHDINKLINLKSEFQMSIDGLSWDILNIYNNFNEKDNNENEEQEQDQSQALSNSLNELKNSKDESHQLSALSKVLNLAKNSARESPQWSVDFFEELKLWKDDPSILDEYAVIHLLSLLYIDYSIGDFAIGLFFDLTTSSLLIVSKYASEGDEYYELTHTEFKSIFLNLLKKHAMDQDKIINILWSYKRVDDPDISGFFDDLGSEIDEGIKTIEYEDEED